MTNLKNKLLKILDEKDRIEKERIKLHLQLQKKEEELNKVNEEFKKNLPSNRFWIYFEGVLYGLSSDDWGGGHTYIETLAFEGKNFDNGDVIEDWTGKLGFHPYKGT